MKRQLHPLLLRQRHLTLALSALLLHCSSPQATIPAQDTAETCVEIEAACHVAAPDSQLVQDCHVLGHQKDEAQCVAQRSGCLAGCEAARAAIADSSGAAGTGGSGGVASSGAAAGLAGAGAWGGAAGSSAAAGSADVGGSGGASGSGGTAQAGSEPGAPPLTCEVHCACLVETCKTEVGYPFADQQACLSTCEGQLTPGLKCLHSFCTFAQQLTDPDQHQHNCEHAWGGLGLAECQ